MISRIRHHEDMREFNIGGPMVPEDHYCIPPLDRVDSEYVLELIREKQYFVFRAPRKTGKTSVLLALQDLLNNGKVGSFRCVYVNVECSQGAGEDVGVAMQAILGELASRARLVLADKFVDRIWEGILHDFGPFGALKEVLTRWAESDPRPLVLLVDEIDALEGDTLRSVLLQLRTGHYRRPKHFPQSVVLCGARELRGSSMDSGADAATICGSPFNVGVDSLRLGNFDHSDVAALVGQHTMQTGQSFDPEALERIWTQTGGQPWLVNAICQRACAQRRLDCDFRCPIFVQHIQEAQEELILARVMHLDQLAETLKQGRVRRVIEPLLSGGDELEFSVRDVEFVRDLGLIATDDPIRIANPIYAEVVPRELTADSQSHIVNEPAWYIDADGSLNLDKLLAAFQAFYRKHSEIWVERFEYKEAGPQLLLQAFLQRIINGGGFVEREYGLGRGRTDILVIWPSAEKCSHFVIECKIRYGSLETAIDEGVEQTAAYMERCDASEGHLVIFDRSTSRGWDEKVFHRREQSKMNRRIDVWGM